MSARGLLSGRADSRLLRQFVGRRCSCGFFDREAVRCPLWDNAWSAAYLLRATRHLRPCRRTREAMAFRMHLIPDEPILASSPAERYVCRTRGEM